MHWTVFLIQNRKSKMLLTQRFRCLDVDRVENLEYRQDDGESNRRLRRGQHNDENREELAIRAPAAEMGKCDVIDIRPVQDQLRSHEHADGISARQHREKAKDK